MKKLDKRDKAILLKLIDLCNHSPSLSDIFNVSEYIEHCELPENIILQLFILDFSYDISKFQPLSKQFIAENLQRLNIAQLFLNLYIPKETKTYIRMFI